ncbi:hypothetical protein ZWY2020_032920 [Hordeum vulgare]|nr:hypothetical protein ZWY2020_032920 [Hordeum vulgare]
MDLDPIDVLQLIFPCADPQLYWQPHNVGFSAWERAADVAVLQAVTKPEEEREVRKRYRRSTPGPHLEAMMLDSAPIWTRRSAPRYCLYFLHMKENGYEEDEAAEIELQLDQHLEEQRSSLAAVDEALAVDASNADLLEVRTRLSVSVPEHVARPRLPEPLSGPD